MRWRFRACPREGGGSHGGEVPDQRAAPPRAWPGREGQCPWASGARDDRGGCQERFVSRPGRRRCVEPCRGEPDTARRAAAGGAVADRESDMYPLWASVPDENVHVLTRAMKDRALVGG